MGVVIHPDAIFPTIFIFIPFPLCVKAIPITDPTIACELDTGTRGIEGKWCDNNQYSRFCDAKRKSTSEEDNTTINADSGVSLKIFVLTVFMTL